LLRRIVSSARMSVEPDFAANCPQISLPPANIGSARSRFVEAMHGTALIPTPQTSHLTFEATHLCRDIVNQAGVS
jgi:hypothetical protein